MQNLKITLSLAFALAVLTSSALADVKAKTPFTRAIPEVAPRSVRPIQASDIQTAPIPDDDAPTPGTAPAGTPNGTSASGTSTAAATTGVSVAGPKLEVRAPLPQQAIIGLVVLSLLSLGSVWASVRLIRGEWDNQVVKA